MAYALVAWEPPPASDPVAVDAAVITAITGYGGREAPIQILDRLWVYPSRPSGVGFTTVRDWLRPVATQFPGIQLLIIMPRPGDTVAGWLDATKDFTRARPILNQSCTLKPDGSLSGTCTYPLIL
jgi:hypothetical protein